MRQLLICLLLLFCFTTSSYAAAHVPEQGYIFLRVYEKEGVEGRFEILTDDLNGIFGWELKTKDNTVDDIQPYYDAITAYIRDHSAFKSVLGTHTPSFKGLDILSAGYGDYVQIFFDLDNFETIPDELDVTYTIGFDEVPTHRGFLVVEYNWKAGVINNESNISLYFTGSEPTDTLSLSEVSVWKGFMAMIRQGIWHIWIGIDHIFFLLALILPSVVRRIREEKSPFKAWTPVERFKPAFYYIIKVVTFFTIAHTITLSLAALKIVSFPGWLVESVIAFSIGLAAFHNIKPIFKGRDWIIAFVFGLFHGFGFASVLGDIGLNDEFLVYSLLGFNVGVEIGQLVIILAIFPFLYLLRKTKLYPKLLIFVSALLILASLYWVIERVFGLNLGVEDAIRALLYKLAVLVGLR